MAFMISRQSRGRCPLLNYATETTWVVVSHYASVARALVRRLADMHRPDQKVAFEIDCHAGKCKARGSA